MANRSFGLFGLLLTSTLLVTGCGGEDDSNVSLDPLKLMESVETSVTRHHPTKYTEVEVGDLYVTLPIPGTIEIYRVNFKLCFVTTKDEADSLAAIIESQESFIHDRVIATFHRLSEEDLHDPDLLWLKTELVTVLRRELKSTEIRDVVFPDFTLQRG